MSIRFLNISSADDIHQLMRELEAGSGGRGANEKLLLSLKLYRQEVNSLARRIMSVEGFQAAGEYNLRLAQLYQELDEKEHAGDVYKTALAMFSRATNMDAQVGSFLRLCEVYRQALTLELPNSGENKNASHMRMLNKARAARLAHPEWEEIPFCRALAGIYEDHAAWYGSKPAKGVWAREAAVRASKLRAHIARQEARDACLRLRDSYIQTATEILEGNSDWDLSLVRSYCQRALGLMRKYPKMPHNFLQTMRAWHLMGASFAVEEALARKAGQGYSAEKSLSYRLKAKDCFVRAMDASLCAVEHCRRRGEEAIREMAELRRCYTALASICQSLPGEKNARKAEKYRWKAGEI